MDEARRQALREWLAVVIDPSFRDATVHRIGIGHSRAMYCVTATGGQRIVVRIEQGGVFGTDSTEESRVMRSLHGVGYPVARILAEDFDGAVLGQPLFVMEFIDGAAAGGEAGADERVLDRPTATAFVDALTSLHRLDGTGFGFDIVPDNPASATPRQVERWHGVCRAASSSPDPLIDEAAAWLIHHAPPLARLAVVHGDAGPGNFVHRAGGVAAVTDWEFAHLGDPAPRTSPSASRCGARARCRAKPGSTCSPREPGSNWTTRAGATGKRSTCSRARAPTEPASTSSSAGSTPLRTWRSSAPCCTRRSFAG